MRQVTFAFDTDLPVGTLIGYMAAAYEAATNSQPTINVGQGLAVNGLPDGWVFMETRSD